MAHLGKRQLHSLQQQLQQREANLRIGIRAIADHRGDEPYAELAGSVPDVADEAVADVIVDLDQALIGRQLIELRDIDAARERIQQHSYGICRDCGQAIDYARLTAYPTAKRCTRCQGLHERTYAEPKHTTL
jgi:RNA polymerase-binding transcription factor DksA